MSFYYEADFNRIVEATGFQKWVLDRQIWLQQHDPVPGQLIYGPFATRDEAVAAQNAHPSGIVNSVTQGVTQATGLTNASIGAWLVRITEVVVGTALLVVAANIILKQTTGIDVAGSAKSGATKAAKVAAVA